MNEDVLKMPHLKAVRAGYKWYRFELVSALQVACLNTIGIADPWSMKGDRPRQSLDGGNDEYVTHDWWLNGPELNVFDTTDN